MSHPSRVRITGPLTPYAQGFAGELRRQGYRPNAVADQLRLMAHVSRWLAAKQLGASDLRPEVREAFLAARREAGYRLWLSPKALVPLMTYLHMVGAAPAEPERTLGPAEQLLSRYRSYLIAERGLTTATVEGYVCFVRPFIAGRMSEAGVDLAGLTAADVTGFVLAACPGRARGSAKLIVTSLRSLLRWLFVEDLISAPLAELVPSVAGWRLAGLPRGLDPAEVRRLLAAFDRRTTTGRRNLAMTLLMVRMGLRAGEVRGLRLDDIDWRVGEVVVRGKGNRDERLPLPTDVGEAVAGYLRRGRPKTAAGRSVFVRIKAPHRPITSSAVSFAVAQAGERAGLGRVGAHRLRHTAATQMVRGGASLSEVRDVLRHRLLLTTAIYAKVDREGLRHLARPWPRSAA
jgi:integrase/recombinase XerD